MTEYVPWLLTAATLILTEWRLRKAAKANESNQAALTHLESGKLDLSVAELGHDIFMDLVTTLQASVAECHHERDEFRTLLVTHGLLPK